MEALYHTAEETKEPIKAKVTGSLPDWLEGSLYRNGPGKFEFGDDKYVHWFDGMSLIHRFHVANGEVTYRNRFLQSESYVTNKAANRIVIGEFGTAAHPDPCKTLYERFFSYFEPPKMTDNCMVNVFPIGDSLFTATETNRLRRIDHKTLETYDEIDLKKVVSVNGATAHPHIDPDGTLYNLGATHEGGFKYSIIKLIPSKGSGKDGNYVEEAEIVAQIPSRWRFHPSYYHSFAITEHYYVFLELPLVINVLKILTCRIRGKSFGDSMEWWPGYQTKLHIVNRQTGQEINPSFQYVTSAMMVFHHINAYEEDDHIVVDVCGFTEGGVVQDFNMENLQKAGVEEYIAGLPRPQGWRLVLPLKLENKNTDENLVTLKSSATAVLGKDNNVYCQYEVLSDEISFEFPQINYTFYNGKKYRYVYGCGSEKTMMDCLIKLDVTSRQVNTWYTPGHYPSEPVFVAAPNAKSEDDGVVLSVVLTTGPSRFAYMLVLDAKTWRELGRAEVNVKIGRDTHGTFIRT